MKERIIYIIGQMIPAGSLYKIMQLFPGKSEKEVRHIASEKVARNLAKGIAVGTALFTLGIFARMRAISQPAKRLYIREDINGIEKRIPVTLNDGENILETEIVLYPLEMSEEETDMMHEKVTQMLDELILGNNSDFDHIWQSLYLPEKIDGLPVEISWSTGDYRLIRSDGTVGSDVYKMYGTVTLSARLSYGDEWRPYNKKVTVVPGPLSESDKAFDECENLLGELEKETRNLKEFELPETVQGITVTPPLDNGNRYVFLGVLGLIFSVIIPIVKSFTSFSESNKKRTEQADNDYKTFVSELALLLAADMSLRRGIRRLASEYGEDCPGHMLTENLLIAVNEMNNGMTEETVYERFGERMGSVRWQRLMSVLWQTSTKGVSDLSDVLGRELQEAVAAEKEMIRVRGEQAGTKLLIPMAVYLCVVFAILVVPAFISFG